MNIELSGWLQCKNNVEVVGGGEGVSLRLLATKMNEPVAS